MFELLEDTILLPVPEDAIVQVHSGMNKLRVSVGNYVSEPSDVYIITSEDGALLRSFIVFFVVEPGIHVIYGYAGNPYDPVFREEVLQEAVDFVEEMGAILEEVPWENMSSEERQKWISDESIYPLEDTNGMEEIVDLEEIELGELQEVIEEEEKLDEEVENQPETLEPEDQEKEVRMEEVEEEELEDEQAQVEQEESRDEEEIGMEVAREEMEEDSDFDDLLKQAFLKPDLVKKSKMKKIAALKEEPPEDEEPSHGEETGADEEQTVEVGGKPVQDVEEPEEDSQSTVSGEDEGESDLVVSDEELVAAEDDDDLSALIQEVSSETYTGAAEDASEVESKHLAPDSGDQTRLTVIRYLSRF